MKQFSLLLVIALIAIIDVTAKDWGAISPLHSSREDVERILGKSKGGPNDSAFAFYETKLENVSIDYTEYTCEKSKELGWEKGWDVPIGTVQAISVFPKSRPRLSELKIDLKDFVKVATHIPNVTRYVNEQEGFHIEVTNDLVSVFIYVPSKKDEHFRCK